MKDFKMDEIFTLLWVTVVPVVLISLLLGRFLTGLVAVGAIWAFMSMRTKTKIAASIVEAAKIKAKADIKAARIAAGEVKPPTAPKTTAGGTKPPTAPRPRP